MKVRGWRLLFLPAGVVVALGAGIPAMAGKPDWKPVDASELSLKEAKVEPGADAEAISWSIRVADEIYGSTVRNVLTHDLRLKVFTDRGRDAQSRFDIPFYGGDKIKDIAARTVKPDGTIVELDGDDVFERTLTKAGGIKFLAKSFVVPAVEPGAILDVHWREIRGGQLANYLRIPLQRDIPIQSLTCSIKPLSDPDFPFSMRYRTFQGQVPKFEKAKDGFYQTTLTNIPAFHEEVYMPPVDQVRFWMLVFYSEDKKLSPEEFWKQLGKEFYKYDRASIKVDGKLKKTAAEVIGSESLPTVRLERLYEFCRTQIKNLEDDSNGMSSDEREKYKSAETAGDTLKRMAGTSYELNALFAALAAAAGFESRLAYLSDRGDVFFRKDFAEFYQIRKVVAAVKLDSGWQFYDPGSKYLPPGMLQWQQEQQDALVPDPKEPSFVATPASAAEASTIRRTGQFRLAEDGTLDGDVKVEMGGHAGVEEKRNHDHLSAREQEDAVQEALKKRLAAAELTEIKVENATDLSKPISFAYHVHVPGYAQRTGKRMIVQPSFFAYGQEPLFTAEKRLHEIYFHYPWAEEDTVTVQVPKGFTLDLAEAPAPLKIADLGRYEASMTFSKKDSSLVYRRSFRFAGMLFPASTYSQIKLVFSTIHERDNRSVSFKLASAETP